MIHIFLIYLFVAVGLDCLLDGLNDFLKKRKSNNKDEQPVEEQTYVDMEKEIKDLQKQLKSTRAYLFLLIVCFVQYMDK